MCVQVFWIVVPERTPVRFNYSAFQLHVWCVLSGGVTGLVSVLYVDVSKDLVQQDRCVLSFYKQSRVNWASPFECELKGL